MSSERKSLFDFQKERIEMIAVDAKARRGSAPFVVLVLDLTDEFAKHLAESLSSEAEVNSQIELAQSKDGLPCFLYDTPEHDADLFFRQTNSWGPFKNLIYTDDVVRVAIVGDGGVSFRMHRIPV
jgi:hypothetical protein